MKDGDLGELNVFGHIPDELAEVFLSIDDPKENFKSELRHRWKKYSWLAGGGIEIPSTYFLYEAKLDKMFGKKKLGNVKIHCLSFSIFETFLEGEPICK